MMNRDALQLRRLGADDVVERFDCGDEDLNDFILTDAPLYYRVRLATSYVLEDKTTGDVIGYFSLAHDRISLTDFPSNSAYNRFRKQFFAQGKMFKSYPALKICRLATDKRYRGSGIGAMLVVSLGGFQVLRFRVRHSDIEMPSSLRNSRSNRLRHVNPDRFAA